MDANKSLAQNPDAAQALEQVIAHGDLSKLSSAERMTYYSSVCESVGVNPLTRPFEYIVLNGRMVLYARKDATDQLRAKHRISVSIVGRERQEDVYVVTARAMTPDGRADESIGAVSIGNLRGDALANALMKCETKAKRRATLSIVGLGWLDETEIETIPGARVVEPENTVETMHENPAFDAPQSSPRASITPARTITHPAQSNAPATRVARPAPPPEPERPEPTMPCSHPTCAGDGLIHATIDRTGKMQTAQAIADMSSRAFHVPLCTKCIARERERGAAEG